MSRKLYAKAGETVTCENGHPICDVARDIHYHDEPKDDDMTNWRQRQPKIGEMSPRCQCGARFWTGYKKLSEPHDLKEMGQFYHFEDGWRGSEDMLEISLSIPD